MGVHGVSKKARMPWPVKNWRIWIKSPKERAGLTLDGARWASKLALNTRVPNNASSRTPERTSTRERIHSAKAITPNKNRVISDIASSVNSLRLLITRSNTCSMYSVGESISTLATMLKTPTIRNSRRKAHRARVSSLRSKKPEEVMKGYLVKIRMPPVPGRVLQAQPAAAWPAAAWPAPRRADQKPAACHRAAPASCLPHPAHWCGAS